MTPRNKKESVICLAQVKARNVILQAMVETGESEMSNESFVIDSDESARMLGEMSLRDYVSDTPPEFAREALEALIERSRLHRKINARHPHP